MRYLFLTVGTSTYDMTPFEVIRHRIDLSAYSEAKKDTHRG